MLGVLPVPEASEIDLFADVGLAEDSLADHTLCGEGDRGDRHSEGGGVVAVEGILNLRSGLT